MFDKQTLTVDTADKVGTLPDLMTSNWTSRNPLRDGAVSIGKYTVPDNFNTNIKLLWPFGQFANIPRVPSLASIPVGIVKLQVNGVDKMEFRVGGIKATFGATVGTADFDVSRRQILLNNGVLFNENDVVRLIVTQDKLTSTGVPQTCYTISFIGQNTSTGATIVEKFRSIVTVETANEVIATYTVLSGGFTLQNITFQTQVGDFMMGHIQIIINGMVVMEYPVSDSMGCTRPSGGMCGMIMLYDGLNLSAGNTIEARIDPSVSVNQKFHLFTAGIETTSGGSVVNRVKRWNNTIWEEVNQLVVTNA